MSRGRWRVIAYLTVTALPALTGYLAAYAFDSEGMGAATMFGIWGYLLGKVQGGNNAKNRHTREWCERLGRDETDETQAHERWLVTKRAQNPKLAVAEKRGQNATFVLLWVVALTLLALTTQCTNRGFWATPDY
jgi:hypothetical protein